MCEVVPRQLLLFVIIIFTVEGTSSPTSVDLTRAVCVPGCKFPQPRSVVVAQEFQTADDTIPYMTVLHRCDEGSGCCTVRGTVCKVANWESRNFTFLLKDRDKKTYVPVTFEAKNHTECSCQSYSDTPK